MKTMLNYIVEKLSEDQIKELEKYLNDENFDKGLIGLKNFLTKDLHNEYSKKYYVIANEIDTYFKKWLKDLKKYRAEKDDEEIKLPINDKQRHNIRIKIGNLITDISNSKLHHNTVINLNNRIKEYCDDIFADDTVYNRHMDDSKNYIMIGGDHDEREDIQLADFLNDKGLSKKYIKWGSKNPEDVFIDIFNDNMDALQQILNTTYKKQKSDISQISWEDFLKNGTAEKNGNIINKYCSKFKKEAIELANITYVKANGASSAIGPFEILLKFLINEASAGKKGDVYIKNVGEVEVKNGYADSGAHICGQHTFKHISVVYDEINNIFRQYNINDDELLLGTDNTTNKGYFQTKDTEKIFIKLYNKCKSIDNFTEDLSKAICKGVLKQYGQEENAEYINKIKDMINSYITSKSFTDPSNIRNVICATQLMTYALQEKFDYFCVVYLHTADGGVQSDSRNGEYRILSKTQLSNISEILKYLNWKKIEGNTTSFGSTGKLILL